MPYFEGLIFIAVGAFFVFLSSRMLNRRLEKIPGSDFYIMMMLGAVVISTALFGLIIPLPADIAYPVKGYLYGQLIAFCFLCGTDVIVMIGRLFGKSADE